MDHRAAELIDKLDLQPHPEGGFYRRIFRSNEVVTPADDRGPRVALTTIYFLLTSDTPSRLHRVRSDEVWHLYEGGPIELVEIDLNSGTANRRQLAGFDGVHEPVHVVAAGVWQAARSLGPYSLMGCTVGPGFDFADFELLADDESSVAIVRETWPDLAFLV
jgi:predicted cupin superfamily sugar epimerase